MDKEKYDYKKALIPIFSNIVDCCHGGSIQVASNLASYLFNTTNDYQEKPILTLIDIIYKNIESTPSIIKYFTDFCLAVVEDYFNVQAIIHAIIKHISLDNSRNDWQKKSFISEVVKGFAASCFCMLEKDEDIEKILIMAIHRNPQFVPEIFYGFARACFNVKKEDERMEVVKKILLEILRSNKNLKVRYNIVMSFARACFLKFKVPFAHKTLLEIANSNQDYQNLVYTAINDLIVSYFYDKDILNTIYAFNNILNGIKDVKSQAAFKIYSINILFKYLEKILFSLKDFVNPPVYLSKCGRNPELELYLLALIKKCNIIDCNIQKFADIPIDSLINKWAQYFNEKIKNIGINGGYFCEILPYILKDFAKGQTLGYLLNNPNLKNFHCINADQYKNMEEFKLLIENIIKSNNTSIIHTCLKGHAFVLIIEEGKIKIVDSSLIVDNMPFEFNFFNNEVYQVNGTCYLNAGIAFKIVLDSYFKSINQNGESSKINLIGEESMERNERLEKILKDLHSGEGREQKIIFEISKEVVKFYELLTQAKDWQNYKIQEIQDSKYLPLTEQNPSTELYIPESRINQSLKMSERTKSLKREVQQITIEYKNYIIAKNYLAKALKNFDYKAKNYLEIQNFRIDKQKNCESANDSTQESRGFLLMEDKIVAKKKSQYKITKTPVCEKPKEEQNIKIFTKWLKDKKNDGDFANSIAK